MKKAELQERTKKFALRVLKLIERLPNTIGGRVLANQLARSGELRFYLGWIQQVTGDHAAAEASWRQARTELEPFVKD